MAESQPICAHAAPQLNETPRLCVVCGKPIATTNKKAKTCSLRCAKKRCRDRSYSQKHNHQLDFSADFYRTLPQYPDYAFGRDGSVWSCRKTAGRSWRKMRTVMGKKHRYVFASIVSDGKKRNLLLHRLILEAFHGPCPEGMQGCHYPINDRTNNSIDNLQWGTPLENSRDHKREHGTILMGETHPRCVLTAEIVKESRRRYAAGESNADLMKRFGASSGAMWAALHHRTWRHVNG